VSHSEDCQAVQARRELTRELARAIRIDPAPADGSWSALERVFDVARGIVAEYQDGGDQMIDLCDCAEQRLADIRTIADSGEIGDHVDDARALVAAVEQIDQLIRSTKHNIGETGHEDLAALRRARDLLIERA